MCVGLLKSSSVLGGGIMLQNCQKILESDTGAKFAEHDAAWVALDTHAPLTVRSGWVAIPVYSDAPKTAPDWAHAWVLPLFSAKAARATCALTLQAIKHFNAEHAKPVGDAPMWKCRAELVHT